MSFPPRRRCKLSEPRPAIKSCPGNLLEDRHETNLRAPSRQAFGPQRLARRGDAHLPQLRPAPRRAEVQAVLPRSPVRVLPLLRGLLLDDAPLGAENDRP